MASSPPPTSTGSSKIDAAIQNASAKSPEKLSGFALYSRFALAGAVCCSVTHGGLTPVDVYVEPPDNLDSDADYINTASKLGYSSTHSSTIGV